MGLCMLHPHRGAACLQWQPRPEGPSGEALLGAGWWRFLAAPETYYDHRRPAGGNGTARSSAAQRYGAGVTASGSGVLADSSASAAPAAAAGSGVGGCDFSHQHDPGDRLLLREAPPWVRQRVAAMDRDSKAQRVRSCGLAPVCMWLRH